MSPAAKALSLELEDFNNWEIDQNYILHENSGITLHVGGGFKMFNAASVDSDIPQFLSFLDRVILYRKYKKMINKYVTHLLKQSNNPIPNLTDPKL